MNAIRKAFRRIARRFESEETRVNRVRLRLIGIPVSDLDAREIEFLAAFSQYCRSMRGNIGFFTLYPKAIPEVDWSYLDRITSFYNLPPMAPINTKVKK